MAVYEPAQPAHYPHVAQTGLQVLCFEVERQLRQLHKRLLGLISDSLICDQAQPAVNNHCSVSNITPQQALLLFQISNGLTKIDDLRAQCVIGVENIVPDLRQLSQVDLLILHQTHDQPPHGVALTVQGMAIAEQVRQLCDQSQTSTLPAHDAAQKSVVGQRDISAQMARLNASLQRLSPYRPC